MRAYYKCSFKHLWPILGMLFKVDLYLITLSINYLYLFLLIDTCSRIIFLLTVLHLSTRNTNISLARFGSIRQHPCNNCVHSWNHKIVVFAHIGVQTTFQIWSLFFVTI
ncbi:hypothetical protein O6H91_19G038200 [Diphasiastrum complanatum]|uniref:Uncharacterized protein n=1 Tax=Diphasiastrum complanatum TaxID=34168 RepID=A0ACC2AUG0_DIPCM|nr:hypothetical protein O6H91_19G038200 [Diphasiastrum complanatum]